MTLYDFLREHESAKIEVSEYGRPLAMFNSQGIKDYETSIRADERRKFAEWMYSVEYHGPDADMEERKNYTIRRWIEDFEQEQKGETE